MCSELSYIPDAGPHKHNPVRIPSSLTTLYKMEKKHENKDYFGMHRVQAEKL